MCRRGSRRLHGRAQALFSECARPVGVVSELGEREFRAVFAGEDKNAADAVLGHIFPEADHLALFALTMGPGVSDRIDELLDHDDLALGLMLDSVASLAADRASEAMAEHYSALLLANGLAAPGHQALSYSPGYCGWHVSAQKKLFEFLGPERIGISLNSSHMMSPLKSVSGVLVSGPPAVHLFSPAFSYCPACQDRPCVERMQRARGALDHGDAPRSEAG
jgi:hypothetical protein